MCVCQHDKFEEELSILPCLDMASAVRTLPHEFQSMKYWAKQTTTLSRVTSLEQLNVAEFSGE